MRRRHRNAHRMIWIVLAGLLPLIVLLSLATAAVELGWVTRVQPETRVGIDAPCGFIEAFVKWDGEHAGNVRFVNVPSFIWKQDVTVETPSFGPVTGDIAFGGAFYFYADGQPHGLEVREASVEELIRFGAEVKAAANKAFPVEHPEIPEINHIYGTIIANAPRHAGSTQANCCVFADREVDRFLSMATTLLSGEDTMEKFEVAAVALLRYIEENSDGFRILVRDSHPASGSGTFASLISDIASQVEYILADVLKRRGYDPKLAPMYSQMLVGMVVSAGQWWLDVRKPKLEEMAAHLVNLAWHGMSALDPKPKISPEASRLLKERPKPW